MEKNLIPQSKFDHILLRGKKEIIYLIFKDIIYIQAHGNYSIFYMTNEKKYVSSHKLKYYEELLDETQFFRINRSYLINKEHIKYYHIDTRELILFNTQILFVSYRKRKSFVSTVYGNSQQLKYDRFIKKTTIPMLSAAE